MIKFCGFSHINIVVDNIEEAVDYYKDIFNAEPFQCFPHFKNNGFAKSAGFLENPDQVDVTIIFLRIPLANLTIELMGYHNPIGVDVRPRRKLTHQIGNVGHIALKVNDIEEAFDFLKSSRKVKFITDNISYKPYKISDISSDEFFFYKSESEKNKKEKEKVCQIVSQIRYFYFVDIYGIQWEFEQGHSGISD